MLLPREKIKLLSMVDILEPLSREQIEELLQRLPDTHFEQGQTLYAPEDRSEALFLLKRGRVRIYTLDREGYEFTLAMVEAGTIFGEMALTAQRLWGAYAEAIEPTDVCALKSEDVESLVREHPAVGLKMIRVLSERLRLCENRLEDIGPKIPTHYTHWQLAAMVGASRVSVTKAFARLQDAGAVELKRRHIYIKDVEALEQAARK